MIEHILKTGDASISGDSIKLAYATELVNNWLQYVNQLLHRVQGEHAYDDANNTGFQIEEFDAVDNQQNYGLSTNGERDNLIITKVEIKGATSLTYSDLPCRLQKDIPEDAFNQDSGTPTSFWLSGGSIVFDCPIDTALVSKYRIWYDRHAHLFATDDTTAEPGFDSAYHSILYYGPSLELAKGDVNVINQCNTALYGNGKRLGLIEEMKQDHIRRSNLVGGNMMCAEEENF